MNKASFFCLAMVSWVSVGSTVGYAEQLVSDMELRLAGLTRYWDGQIPMGADDTLRDIYWLDDTIYAVTQSGTLFSIRADVGLIRWVVPLTTPGFQVFRPAPLNLSQRGDAQNEAVAFMTSDSITVLNKLTGKRLASFTPEFPPGSPPTGDGKTLYLGSSDSTVYAVVPFLGCSGHGADLFQRWSVRVDGPVVARPIRYGLDRLLIATRGGRVFSCFAPDKVFGWTTQLEGAVEADPVVTSRGAFVASLDRSVYRIDVNTGRVLWRYRLPTPLTDSPVVIDETVYQFDRTHGIVAVDADRGVLKWECPEGRSFVVRHNGRDVLRSRDGQLLIVERETGKLLYTLPCPVGAFVLTNVEDDAIYIVTREGSMLCVRGDRTPYLHQQQVLAALRELNRPKKAEVAAPLEIEAVKSKVNSDRAGKVTDPLRSRYDAQSNN